MKKVFISAINFYQIFLSTIILQLLGVRSACRFKVSCSQYAKYSIERNGVIKGGYLSLIRILKCQPFYNVN